MGIVSESSVRQIGQEFLCRRGVTIISSIKHKNTYPFHLPLPPTFTTESMATWIANMSSHAVEIELLIQCRLYKTYNISKHLKKCQNPVTLAHHGKTYTGHVNSSSIDDNARQTRSLSAASTLPFFWFDILKGDESDRLLLSNRDEGLSFSSALYFLGDRASIQ